MEIKDIINIVAIVLSPMLAVGLTIWLTKKNEKRKEKMEAFKQLMVSRAIFNSIDTVKLLNCIDVIFADNKKVQIAWKDLYEEFANPNMETVRVFSKQTKLIEEVAKDLGYKNIEWNKIISNYYLPRWLSVELEQSNKMREGQNSIIELVKNAAQNIPQNSEHKGGN